MSEHPAQERGTTEDTATEGTAAEYCAAADPATEDTAAEEVAPVTHTVAIDLGGTHTRAAVVDRNGEVIVSERCRTPVGDPSPTIIPRLIAQVSESAVTTGVSPPPGRAVIGVAGVVDHESERLLIAPNLPSRWVECLNEDWLSAATGLAVAMANDADLAAVGESTFGAGRGFRDVVYVTISTGVGAGVVVADKLVRAALSGGEVGHTVIDRHAAAKGRPCTVEELGSGTAIERAARAAGLTETGSELAALVRSGHRPAADIWSGAIEAVGIGIANLAWIVAPHVVVVGGGVGMNHDLVVPILQQQLSRHGPIVGDPIEIVTAKLGDQAALAGAAAWWSAVGRG